MALVLGNGSNEIIELVIRAFLTPGDEVIMPAPSFLLYRLVVQWMGGKPIPVPLKSKSGNRPGKDGGSGHAENEGNFPHQSRITPRAAVISKSDFDAFLSSVPPDVVVVLDEAYIEFNRNPDTPSGFDYIGKNGPGVVALRTFSKAYGLAGLRIGFGAMDPDIASFLNRVRQPFNTGSLAQAAALAALDDEEFLRRTQANGMDGLQYLYDEVEKMGLTYIPSEANFFLIEVALRGEKIIRSHAPPRSDHQVDGFLRHGTIHSSQCGPSGGKQAVRPAL